jgi:hypothetical protein
MRDREEMVDLINTRLTVAASEDYGKDLQDVERLIHNFDLFMDNLGQHEEKLSKLNMLSNELMNDGVDYDIEEKTKEVRFAFILLLFYSDFLFFVVVDRNFRFLHPIIKDAESGQIWHFVTIPGAEHCNVNYNVILITM